MKLSTLLRPSLIRTGLDAVKGREAIGEVLDLLVQDYEVPYGKRNDVFEELLAHEEEMPSGMEYGVAIPHAVTERVESILCALGTSARGIPFDSLDGSLCRIVLLMLIPANDLEGRIHTLRTAAELFERRDVVKRLMEARSPEEAYQVILDAEAAAEKE